MKTLWAALSLMLVTLSPTASKALDYFDFSVYTIGTAIVEDGLGTGKRSITGTFTGENGVITGFTGSFTAPGGSYQLTFSDLDFFTGSYNSATFALTSLSFDWDAELGNTGTYTYDAARNRLTYTLPSGSGNFDPMSAEVFTLRTPSDVPEINGSGLAYTIFILFALLTSLAAFRRQPEVTDSRADHLSQLPSGTR